jgi:hypothetical protein
VDAPVKTNADILADQQAFMAAYDRAREAFGAINGVLSVGFGQKQRGGSFTDDVGIIVFVKEKKPAEELAPDQLIPSSFEGYRTDVRTPLRTVPGGCDNDTAYDTIQGGIQIESGNATELGTLGCIARKRGDTGRENVYVLSNKHVLYGGGAGAGDYTYHPYAPSRGGAASRPSTALGPIQALSFYANVTATVPGPPGSGGTVTDTFFIDCATARVDLDSKCCGSTCTKDVTKYDTTVVDLQVGGANTFTDVRSVARDVSIVVPSGAGGPFVFKVGRTTGKTKGIVRSINATLHTLGDPSIPGSPPMTGQNVIEIAFDPASTATGTNCHGNPFFAEHGDSGSIVVDENRRVIGIIHGVPDPSIPGSSSAAACHILPVLDNLGICIPTTGGTSHGSCSATDGSGTAVTTTAAGAAALSGPAPATEATGGKEPVTVSPGSAGSGAVEPPAPQLMTITDAEYEHLIGLRDALRQTQRGRDLHDLFGQVRREVGYLVRNNRQVMVAWHRGHGPAFLTHILNHLRGRAEVVALEVDGVHRAELLDRMADLLVAHGSNPLRAAIERHRNELMPILSSAGTVQEALALFATAVGPEAVAQ